MLTIPGITPVDYLLIGHITQDLTPHEPRPGGTAAYASLTARALGLRVGIVTAWGEESGADLFKGITIANQPSKHSTTFENIYTPAGRVQKLHHLAQELDYYHIPETWRSTRIVHLAPVAGELPPNLVRLFPDAHVYLTIQGWLRQWDANGSVTPDEWPEAGYILQQAHATVISEEDVQHDAAVIETFAAAAPILAVTHGAHGATVYAEGKAVHIPAPQVKEIDPTGAGDIFAAAFFAQLSYHHDPIRAAQFAALVAARFCHTPRAVWRAHRRDLIPNPHRGAITWHSSTPF